MTLHSRLQATLGAGIKFLAQRKVFFQQHLKQQRFDCFLAKRKCPGDGFPVEATLLLDGTKQMMMMMMMMCRVVQSFKWNSWCTMRDTLSMYWRFSRLLHQVTGHRGQQFGQNKNGSYDKQQFHTLTIVMP
jgi:hypothetical protein